MLEIWKDVEGYEGIYQISDQGRVKSLARYRSDNLYWLKEKILIPNYDTDKYLKLDLCKDGKRKTFTIHKLVARGFYSSI